MTVKFIKYVFDISRTLYRQSKEERKKYNSYSTFMSGL